MKKGTIINCFYLGSPGGIGDFLRGSIHLYEICKFYKLNFDISLQNHPIYEFINFDNEKTFDKNEITCISSEIKKDNYFNRYKKKLHELLASTSKNETKYISSTYSFLCSVRRVEVINLINKTRELSDDCREFFAKRLKFSEAVQDLVKKELKTKGLKKKEFNVIHFRLGDESSFYETDETLDIKKYRQCFCICEDNFNNDKYPLIVISDNNKLKNYIKQKAKEKMLPFHVFHLQSNHTQEEPSGCEKTKSFVLVNREDLLYVVFDMILISLARRGYSYSVYDHGSGFFCWLCKIYKVPFTMQKFKKEK